MFISKICPFTVTVNLPSELPASNVETSTIIVLFPTFTGSSSSIVETPSETTTLRVSAFVAFKVNDTSLLNAV